MAKKEIEVRCYKSPLFDNGNNQLPRAVGKGISEYLEFRGFSLKDKKAEKKATMGDWNYIKNIINKSLYEGYLPINSQKIIDPNKFLSNLEKLEPPIDIEKGQVPYWNLIITPDLLFNIDEGRVYGKTRSNINQNPMASTIISTSGFSGLLKDKLELIGFRHGLLAHRGECSASRCLGSSNFNETMLEHLVKSYKNHEEFLCKIHSEQR